MLNVGVSLLVAGVVQVEIIGGIRRLVRRHRAAAKLDTLVLEPLDHCGTVPAESAESLGGDRVADFLLEVVAHVVRGVVISTVALFSGPSTRIDDSAGQ